MATRRDFTFGSLVLALTGASSARAGGLKKVATPGAENPVRLHWAHRVSHRRGVLSVESVVTNLANEAVEVVTARGPLPGAHLSAFVAVAGERTELMPILKGDRREVFMSRMGPIPEWAPLASKDRLEMGPYEFAWPAGVPLAGVELVGGLDTQRGYQEFSTTVHPTAAPKSAS